METWTTRYAGDTAKHYLMLSEAGLAPQIVEIREKEIVAMKHTVLKEWLQTNPSDEDRQTMKRLLKELLLAVHETGFCHRDVHTRNVVVPEDGQPLIIDPAYVHESANEHCYDLGGPQLSGVPVPEDHVKVGGDHVHGVWWGSPVRYDSLREAFGSHD